MAAVTRRRILPALLGVALACTLIAALVGAIYLVLVPRLRANEAARLWDALEEKRLTLDSYGRLLELWDAGYLTNDRAWQVLERLADPHLVVRDSYPCDQPVAFTVRHPARTRCLMNWIVEMSVEYRVPGAGGYMAARGWGLAMRAPCFGAGKINPDRADDGFLEPGVYTFPVNISYQVKSVRREFDTVLLLDGPVRHPVTGEFMLLNPENLLSFGAGPVAYQIRRQCEARIVVTPPRAAASVGLVSNPDLDARVKRSFAARTPFGGYLYGRNPRRRMTGGADIWFADLPVPVAFKAVFRDLEGKEWPLTYGRKASACFDAGESGVFDWVTFDVNQFTKTGTYRETLILVPDPDLAHLHADIREIWGGTLEFPVTFTVGAHE